MIGESQYTERFIGGDIVQLFLKGSDYHRFHSPISGVILSVATIPGLFFTNREIHDYSRGTDSLGFASSTLTRKAVFIQADDPAIGVVCMIAIGITEVSSVSVFTDVGQHVKKGDQVGWFSYGGSSIVLLFEPKVVRHFMVETAPEEKWENGQEVKARGHIATTS